MTAMKLTLALVLAAATAVQAQQPAGNCKDVHIFLARGNNEPYPGRQGNLVAAICKGLASCSYEDIAFSNALEDPYCPAVEQGVAAGLAQIRAYNKRCPDAKLVVSGYSQGAHVVGDILGGGGGTFFQNCVEKTSSPLGVDSAAGKKIVAALVAGDTRHNAGEPYNVLSGAGHDGLFPRPADQLSALNNYGARFHDYCVETDPICAGGKTVADHLSYYDKYSDLMAAWVHQRIEAAGGDGAQTTTASSSATKTASETSGVTTTTDDKSATKTPNAKTTATSKAKTTKSKGKSASKTTSGAASSSTETDKSSAAWLLTAHLGGLAVAIMSVRLF